MKQQRKGKLIESAAAYHVFYRLLREAVIKKILGGITPEYMADDSPKLWTLPKVKQIYREILGGGNANESKYFHLKEIHFNSNDTGVIDPHALTKALFFIGLNLGSRQFGERDWDNKSNYLWDEFQTRYKAKILTETRKEDNESSDFSNPVENPNFERISRTIIDFYNNISTPNYEAAWNLLTNNFHERVWKAQFDRLKENAKGGPIFFKNEFEIFKDGYSNTHGIDNVMVLNHHQGHPDLISCLVLYDEHGSAWSSDFLPISSHLTIEKLDQFCDGIKKLRQHLEEKGLAEAVTKIELHKVFETNVADYIAFRCGFPLSKLSTIFNSPRTYTVKRAFECTCQNHQGEWLIHRLVGMKIDNLR